MKIKKYFSEKVSHFGPSTVAILSRGREKEGEELKRFIAYIDRIAERIWYRLNDESSFRYECYLEVVRTIRTNKSGVDLERKIFRNIHRTKSKYLNSKWRSREVEGFMSLDGMNAEDDQIEIVDVLADVEKVVIEKEEEIELIKKFASLARGDDLKKRIVLKCWIEGMSDSDAARVLAHRCGGSFDASRKFIQRFKNRCRQAYVA